MTSMPSFRCSELATTAGTAGCPNEDYAAAGPDWAVVLDGATHLGGVDTGCVHDVPWLVSQLAATLVSRLILGGPSLPEILATAIDAVCSAHADSCDLTNPDSPSSTVAMVLARENTVEYLVLGDSPVIFQAGNDTTVIADDRLDRLQPQGRPYSRALVRSRRNAAGGFWVASTNPQAASEAVSGAVDAPERIALLTDGVTRLADRYGYEWHELLAVLDSEGPAGLIRQVREAERMSPQAGQGPGKRHDDATAVYIRVR